MTNTIAQNLIELSNILSDSFQRCRELCSSYSGIESYSTLSSAIDQIQREQMQGEIFGYKTRDPLVNLVCDVDEAVAYSFATVNFISSLHLPQLTSMDGDTFNGNSTIQKINCYKLSSVGNNYFNGVQSLSELWLYEAKTIAQYAFSDSGKKTRNSTLRVIHLPEKNRSTLSVTEPWSCVNLQTIEYF